MISQPNPSGLNQALPPLRTLFPDYVFKPANDRYQFSVPSEPKESSTPVRPQDSAMNLAANRRVSRAGNSSTPPLSFSPSPSPRLPLEAGFRLVPCSLNQANVVVTHSDGTSATLLIGSAMQHAVRGYRKVHPYRIIRKA